MSLESQFKSNGLLEKIEPIAVIKNEPEIVMDQDIISADIKDEIDIEYHIIPEDLIKNEPNPNNLLKSEHLESVETQIFIQTENTPFIKTEFENLVKTEDTSDGNLISESTYKKGKAKIDNCHLKHHCNKCTYKTLWKKNLEKHKVIHLKPNKIQYLCYHCAFKSKYKWGLKHHIFTHFKNGEIPFHCYLCDFITSKRNLIIKHFKKHPKHHSKWDETEYKTQMEAYTKKRIRYYCKKCLFRTYKYAKLKLHELSHEAERDDQHLKYHCCDQCKYKTFRLGSFKLHKLLHLKPEETPYLCCYHCPYKSIRKNNLYRHILKHFKNEEVPFHCYLCDFITSKRNLIIEHFKKHPEHHSKWDETEYKNQIEAYTKKKRYCCKKCWFRTYQHAKLKLHELSHEGERDDQHLKYRCDQCKYKTFRLGDFNLHKLSHLKPEEIPYLYCYHCSYKSVQKCNIRSHIFVHFKNEEVPFHCYICDFVTLKRHLIIEHFKKHPEHHSKCDETDYKINLKLIKNRYVKKCMFSTYQQTKLKQHELSHEAERDDQHLPL